VAVVGRYLSASVLDSTVQVDYTAAVGSILEQGAHQALLDHLVICDGHPFMRREVFQRHCAYRDRAIGLIPLYFQLLTHGSLVVVDKPLFQHLTNGDSLSGSMSEAWFLDMCHADLELAVSGATAIDLRPRLSATRDMLLRLVYSQAVRMATNRGLPLVQWLFLRRLDAIGGAGADLLVKCEVHWMHDFLAARLAQLIGDACFAVVRIAPNSLTARLLPELRLQLPGVSFITADTADKTDTTSMADALSLVDTVRGAPSGAWLALDDLYGQLRLAPFAGGLVLRGERVSVAHADPAAQALLTVPTRAFDVIRARYASDTVPVAKTNTA